MSEPRAVILPQLNANELEVRLAELPIHDGQRISAGDPLAILETTKSTSQLLAETGGYIIGLHFKEGEAASSGDVLCYLADQPGAIPPEPVLRDNPTSNKGHSGTPDDMELPAGLRITQPALVLANQHGIDLGRFPRGPMVTASEVKSLIEAAQSQPTQDMISSLPGHFSSTSLVIYGGGGHGKSLIELVRALGTYTLVGIIDDGLPVGSSILDLPVLGGSQVLRPLAQRGVLMAVNAVGGIGNLAPRLKVFDHLIQSGFTCPKVAHPMAFIEASAQLSDGVQVFPLAYIGSSSRLGFGVIANTGAIISHDCILSDYVNISPGAILAGGVTIGERTLIGMGVTINLGVNVGNSVRIGNGATIKSDVPAGKVVHAGSVWPSA